MAKNYSIMIPHNVIRVPRNIKDQEKKKTNRVTKGGGKEVYTFQIHTKTLLVSLRDTLKLVSKFKVMSNYKVK